MPTYKVHIRKHGDETTYTTNATILATVTYRADFDKYDASTPDGSVLASTAAEADATARKSIRAFLANIGITPQFIND